MSESLPFPLSPDDIAVVARRIAARADSGLEVDPADLQVYQNYLVSVDPIVDARERAESLTDAGTGLLSRRGLERFFQQSVAQARRLGAKGTTLGVLLDIEGMSRVNNSARGGMHVVDETLLRPLGSALQESIRDGDLVGRFGGDEFEILGITDSPALGMRSEIAARIARTTLGRYVLDEDTAGFPLESVGLIANAATLPMNTGFGQISAHIDPKKGIQKSHDYSRLPDGASLNRVYLGRDTPTAYLWATNEGGLVVPYKSRYAMGRSLTTHGYDPLQEAGVFEVETKDISPPYPSES